METLTCPYCDCQTEVEAEDLRWKEDEEMDFKCPRCEKDFNVRTLIRFSFICEEKDD